MWLKRLLHDVEHHVCTGGQTICLQIKKHLRLLFSMSSSENAPSWGSEIKVAYRIRGLCPRIEVANFLVCTKNEAANPSVRKQKSRPRCNEFGARCRELYFKLTEMTAK